MNKDDALKMFSNADAAILAWGAGLTLKEITIIQSLRAIAIREAWKNFDEGCRRDGVNQDDIDPLMIEPMLRDKYLPHELMAINYQMSKRFTKENAVEDAVEGGCRH
ncbi:MAG: hypothetical protein ACYDEV_04425 [Acidiferrobacter sp.]